MRELVLAQDSGALPVAEALLEEERGLVGDEIEFGEGLSGDSELALLADLLQSREVCMSGGYLGSGRPRCR